MNEIEYINSIDACFPYDDEAKFWLEPIVSLAVSHGLTPRRLGEIQRIIEAREDEIIKAWQSHFRKR